MKSKISTHTKTNVDNSNYGSKIEFVNIGKKYEGRAEYTLQDINLTIESGDFLVILGPSGCGKTTLLRMVAGLNSVTRGDLLFDGKRVNELEPGQRDIAMVFQSYALYPNMNVYKNMSFGLIQQKVRKDLIDRRVKDIAKILRIENHLYDKPKDLSGGQRQRVAIGRAIARKPKIFLMDEPLSNLDAKLRESMRRELVSIHNLLKTTSIYVTHDQLEAMTMATKIVLMNNSIIQQVGSPRELYLKPANIFVAQFIGSPTMNLIEGVVEGTNFVSTDRKVVVNLEDYKRILKHGQHITIGVRTEDYYVDDIKKHRNTFKLIIESVEMIGKEQIVIGKIKDSATLVSLNVSNLLDLKVGGSIEISINSSRIHIFDTKSTNRIN